MSRINVCPACNALKNGVKSRIALEHTCGLQPGEIPPSLLNEMNKKKEETFEQKKERFKRNIKEDPFDVW